MDVSTAAASKLCYRQSGMPSPYKPAQQGRCAACSTAAEPIAEDDHERNDVLIRVLIHMKHLVEPQENVCLGFSTAANKSEHSNTKAQDSICNLELRRSNSSRHKA